MLGTLIDAYRASLSRDELAEITGYTASRDTFGKYLGTLQRNGLMGIEGQQIRAGDTLLPSTEREAGNA
jgi:hypothetical protein